MFRSSVRVLLLASFLAPIAALPLSGQETSTKEPKAANSVPQSARPPAGLCQVWLENVPVSQQPAPTDCATAIKNRPNNARIVFGKLKEDAPRPQLKSATTPSTAREGGWTNHLSDPPRSRDGAAGVHPVNSTMPAVRPTSDSGPKRRP
ncbi:MAG TPA: hypothetical protein VF368_06720 [Gemmatimonadaceae bacterium]